MCFQLKFVHVCYITLHYMTPVGRQEVTGGRRKAAGCDREVTSMVEWVEMSQDLKEGSEERVVIAAMLRSVQRPPC